MNKKELVMSMLKGNEPRMLMGYVTNVKTEVDDRMPKFGDYYSGPVFGKEGRRADLKVTLEFVFFTEDDEGIKEAHDFLDDIKSDQGKAHTKMPFMIMRTE
jgi:hypothetical protein